MPRVMQVAVAAVEAPIQRRVVAHEVVPVQKLAVHDVVPAAQMLAPVLVRVDAGEVNMLELILQCPLARANVPAVNLRRFGRAPGKPEKEFQ